MYSILETAQSNESKEPIWAKPIAFSPAKPPTHPFSPQTRGLKSPRPAHLPLYRKPLCSPCDRATDQRSHWWDLHRPLVDFPAVLCRRWSGRCDPGSNLGAQKTWSLDMSRGDMVTLQKRTTSWCFQPTGQILVRGSNHPQVRFEKKISETIT